jgi:DNA polymerase elongation subunit (family B)
MQKPQILCLDIETLPLELYGWGLYDQNFSISQIKSDWTICAFSAIWLGQRDNQIIYRDCRFKSDCRDDRDLVRTLSSLINRADIVITKNGESFDLRKLNARAAIHRLPVIKPIKSIDIEKESRKVFALTSQGLEYSSSVLNDKYKKQDHKEYPGFKLWRAILDGDKKAWKSMEKYNVHDTLATKEQFEKYKGWYKLPSIGAIVADGRMRCPCGSTNLGPRGYAHTEAGKYRIYRCSDCGKWPRSSTNLLGKEQRRAILRNTVRI